MKQLAVLKPPFESDELRLLNIAAKFGFGWASGLERAPLHWEGSLLFQYEVNRVNPYVLRFGNSDYSKEYHYLKFPEQEFEIVLYLNEFKKDIPFKMLIKNLRKEINHATRD